MPFDKKPLTGEAVSSGLINSTHKFWVGSLVRKQTLTFWIGSEKTFEFNVNPRAVW
jgi:hypothetical protein